MNLVAGLDGSVVISDLLSNNLDMSNVNSVLFGGGSLKTKPMPEYFRRVLLILYRKIYDKLRISLH